MAILIVLSMVFAYSGFSRLANTSTANQQNIDIPPEVQAQLDLQKNGITGGTGASTPEEQSILDAINDGTLNIDPETNADGTVTTPQEGTDTPATPPVQELKLEI